MLVTVECECGEQFDIDVEYRVYKAGGAYEESFMGKKHCPNPDCDKTVHIEANVYACVELDEDEVNPRVDWDEVKVGDTMKYDGYCFEVAHKCVWKSQDEGLAESSANLLYLRSFGCRENLILEVRKSGFMSLFENLGIKYTTKGPLMWTEEELKLLMEKEDGNPNEN